MKKKYGIPFMLAICTWLTTSLVQAQEIRFKCSYTGNGCAVWRDLLNRYEAQHPTVKIIIDVVPYQAILEALPVELAGGNGPDLAIITDYPGLSRYYLDLSPYVDATYWEENFGDTQGWYRPAGDENGIYGMQTQLTVSGVYINRTLFDQAGVAVPAKGASFDEWAEVVRRVAKATAAAYPMAMDRSGHRFAGPAIAYGAKFFDDSGQPVLVDDGFRAFAEKFVEWHKDGTMAGDVWGGLGGDRYRDAAQEFINGQLVWYYSGNWQVEQFTNQIGNAFDWEVPPAPCGPASCSGMVGGAGIVGFKQTRHPEIVADIINYLAQTDIYQEFTARTINTPAHRGVIAAGVTYDDITPVAQAALSSWAAQLSDLEPVAYTYQGYKHNRVLSNTMVQRITQVIAGELSLDEALKRASADVENALKQVE